MSFEFGLSFLIREGMIKAKKTINGILLPIHVAPGASRSRVTGELDGRLKIAVAAAPERGKANQAVLKLLAKALELRKSQLSIVAGTTSRRKTVEVQDLTEAELLVKLEAVLKT